MQKGFLEKNKCESLWLIWSRWQVGLWIVEDEVAFAEAIIGGPSAY